MESYLTKVKSEKKTSKTKREEPVEETVDVEPVLTEEEASEFEEPKVSYGFFASIKNWFAGSEDIEEAEEAEEENAPVLEVDIKEALKIQNKWLMKLPAKTIREFKESEDYARYKEILVKYNLIK
jgi:hypothetical protein